MTDGRLRLRREGDDAVICDELVLGDLRLPLVPGSCRIASQDLVVTARCELTEVPPFLLAAFD